MTTSTLPHILSEAEFFSASEVSVQQLLNLGKTVESDNNYPPYNIIQDNPDTYRVVLAVAGFSKDELSVIYRGVTHTLEVTGEQKLNSDEGVVFLYKGIATRKFIKKIHINAYDRITGAEYKDGLLAVTLTKETPEERIHKIAIL